MMDYGEVCSNCIVLSNKVASDWCKLLSRKVNFGGRITNPYNKILLDELNGGEVLFISDMCQEIKRSKISEFMIDSNNMLIATKELIRAFCEIIGEKYSPEYLQSHLLKFWSVAPISGEYNFTLRDMWLVVNDYAHWLEKYRTRDQIESVVKDWYSCKKLYKSNLYHWLSGAIA